MLRVKGCKAAVNRGGFTLVEVLVALGVFAVGIAALAPLLVNTVRSNEAAGMRSRALALAQAKLEDLRALSYDAVAHLPGGAEALPEGYVRRWAFVDAPFVGGDGDDLRRVVVTVSWDRPGPGSVSLPASRARY